jgi:hypothetical protein
VESSPEAKTPSASSCKEIRISLRERIHQRVDEMFRRGWWRRPNLSADGPGEKPDGVQAIGSVSGRYLRGEGGTWQRRLKREDAHPSVCQAAADLVPEPDALCAAQLEAAPRGQ